MPWAMRFCRRLEEVSSNTVGRDIIVLKPIFPYHAEIYDLVRSSLELPDAPLAIESMFNGGVASFRANRSQNRA
jgi:hypothetical protein